MMTTFSGTSAPDLRLGARKRPNEARIAWREIGRVETHSSYSIPTAEVTACFRAPKDRTSPETYGSLAWSYLRVHKDHADLESSAFSDLPAFHTASDPAAAQHPQHPALIWAVQDGVAAGQTDRPPAPSRRPRTPEDDGQKDDRLRHLGRRAIRD
jgi:hypothetical protein